MTVMHKTDYPSIGYLFGLGATTFWECWGEPELDKKWGARSLNHPMQAAYDAWFMQGLGGIRCDLEGPGFRKIILRPEQLISGLQSVNTYTTNLHQDEFGVIGREKVAPLFSTLQFRRIQPRQLNCPFLHPAHT